jgi:hypothetical protein
MTERSCSNGFRHRPSLAAELLQNDPIPPLYAPAQMLKFPPGIDLRLGEAMSGTGTARVWDHVGAVAAAAKPHFAERAKFVTSDELLIVDFAARVSKRQRMFTHIAKTFSPAGPRRDEFPDVNAAWSRSRTQARW